MALPLLWLYLTGVVIGISVMRDPIPSRLLTALVWPLGPAAFVVVVTLLLIVATILWPVIILGVAAALAILAWLV